MKLINIINNSTVLCFSVYGFLAILVPQKPQKVFKVVFAGTDCSVIFSCQKERYILILLDDETHLSLKRHGSILSSGFQSTVYDMTGTFQKTNRRSFCRRPNDVGPKIPKRYLYLLFSFLKLMKPHCFSLTFCIRVSIDSSLHKGHCSRELLTLFFCRKRVGAKGAKRLLSLTCLDIPILFSQY